LFLAQEGQDPEDKKQKKRGKGEKQKSKDVLIKVMTTWFVKKHHRETKGRKLKRLQSKRSISD